MMAAADEAVKHMYSWIEQKKRSAKELQKLANELEDLRDKCNKSEVVGNTVAVVGFAAMIVGGAAMFFTGGLAAPAVALVGSVCSSAGTVITVGTKITEHFSRSSTLKKATKIEEDCNRMAKKLQQLFEQLRAKSPFTDPDQNDQYVLKEMLGAMARRSGLSKFDPSFLLDDHRFNFGGQRTSMTPNPVFVIPPLVGFLGVMCFFSFGPKGQKLKLLLATGSKKLVQELSSIGLKTAVKGGVMVAGGALGLMFSLPEAIESWKKLTTGNHVTEASEHLRNTARAFLDATRAMKRELDEIKKTFDRLKEVKLCIENPQRTWADKIKLIEFAIDLCNDEEVKQWLKENCTSPAFFNFVDIFNLVAKEMEKNSEEEEEEEEEEEGEIDIVFVAHGSITGTLIPSSCLLPSHSIKDVLLYSPWNCAIDSEGAYGIASGQILPQHREFYCPPHKKCPIPDFDHQPTRLPNDWNRMRRARGGLIPNIMLSPVGIPLDEAWKAFMYLRNAFGIPDKKRVIIPFMLPGNMHVRVPFYVFTSALSVILSFFKLKATVHLSACLSKISEDTELDVDYLINQYSYTIDETFMSCSRDVFPIEDQRLYQLLRMVFD